MSRRVVLLVLVAMLALACGPSGGEAGGEADVADAGGDPTAEAGGGEEAAEPAAEFPSANMQMIIPYGPGGGGDAYARGLATAMSELAGDVEVVPENILPTAEALSTLFRAEPDGLTIGYLPMPAGIGTQLQFPDEALWETSEYTVLGSVDENGYVLYVQGDGPYQTAEDLQAAEGLSTLNTEAGSGASLAGAVLIEALELDAEITYGIETSVECANALTRGEIDFCTHGVTDYPGFVDSGDIRPILFLGTDEQRTEGVEWVQDLPDYADVDMPELVGVVSELRVFVAPPGLPEETTAALQDFFYEAATSDSMVQWAEEAERPLIVRDSEEAAEIMNAQIEAMAELVPRLQESGLL